MIRTQIQLDARQARELKRLAAARGVSMAELVREGVDHVLASAAGDDAWEAALAVVGKFRGTGDAVAEHHDDYLDDAFAS